MSRRRNVTRDDTTTAHICGLCPRERPETTAICGHCTDVLLDDLIALHDWLYAALEAAITGVRAAAYGPGSGGGDDHDVRINWRAAQAKAEINRVMLGILKGIVIGWPEWVTGPGPTLADWLSRNTVTIAASPKAIALVPALHEAVRQALRVIDLPPERQLIGRCPACNQGRVYADPISDYGRCDTCRERTEAGPLWDQMITDVQDQLVTAAEAARLALVMGLTDDREKVRNRIRTWATRDLQKHHNPDGTTVYRFGDVWERLITAREGTNS